VAGQLEQAVKAAGAPPDGARSGRGPGASPDHAERRGDALDAVVAAVAAARAWPAADHRAIARHSRYPREGRQFV
jgi:hypothetical protein